MVYKPVYSHSAEKDLSCLPKTVASRITNKILEYCSQKTPLEHAKKLKGIEIPTYRFRVGDYRAIFRLDAKTKQVVILVVLKVAHRKQVY